MRGTRAAADGGCPLGTPQRPSGAVPCPVAWYARVRPEAEALVEEGRVWTYRTLDAAARRAEAGLRAEGIVRGDVVALRLRNDAAFPAVLVALLRIGAVACPISTRHPATAVADALRRSGAAALVARAAVDAPVPTFDPDALVGAEGAVAAGVPRLATGAPATIVFTSGSTGAPKAALHTWGNHHFSALGSAANLPLDAGDRWLLALPLYHVGGLAILVRAFTAGAAVALPPPGAAPVDVLEPLGITHASLVSTQLVRWLRTEAPPPPRLRAILLGGSAMPDDALGEAHRRGLPIHTSYGLTEMASQVTTTPPGADPAALRSSGRRLAHRALRIAADGEILVRGATLFAGYLEAGRLAPAVDEAGWFHTRDLGRLDVHGCLHVTGRRDNRFVSGGENVQPEEIEAALCAIPGVEAAVVVPVADAEFGARPVAFVRGGAGAAALREALARSLARFKLPVAFLPLPEDDGLKPDRARLARAAAERLRADGNAEHGADGRI